MTDDRRERMAAEMAKQASLGWKRFRLGARPSRGDGRDEWEWIEWADAFANLAALASSPSDGEPPKPVACEHVPLGFEDDECSECEEKPVIAVLESGEQLCLACFGERFDEMAAKLTTERDRPLDPDPVAGRFSGIGKLASVAAHPPRSAPASPADIGMLYAIALRDETPPEDRKHLRALADRLAAAPAEREPDTDLLLDVWGQFSEDAGKGDGWRMDLALSTLEWVATVLVERGKLEKHPTMDWYRKAAPAPDGDRETGP